MQRSKLGVFATHPIQYLVPIWRALARECDVDLRVFFFSDSSVRGAVDPDFGVSVAWDVPLLQGYQHTFLDRTADETGFRRARIPGSRRTIRNGRFDWIMVHGYTHAFERQAIFASRRHGVRTMMRGEFTDAPRPGRSFARRMARTLCLRCFYRFVDRFCYLDRRGKEHLLAHGVAAQRLHLSPYAVDSELFDRQSRRHSRGQSRAALGIQASQTVVLFSGKMIPRKEPMLLVEALRHLASHRSIHLILLGDGPLRRDVESAARSIVGPQLTMPGFVNQRDLGKYYSAADVFVLPSRFETWGLVVNEAMHFGLPVVVSSGVGCHHELVVSGRTGFVFPSADAEELGQCLRRLMQDREHLAWMGSQARSHIGGFTTDASVRGILSALDGHNETRRRER